MARTVIATIVECRRLHVYEILGVDGLMSGAKPHYKSKDSHNMRHLFLNLKQLKKNCSFRDMVSQKNAENSMESHNEYLNK